MKSPVLIVELFVSLSRAFSVTLPPCPPSGPIVPLAMKRLLPKGSPEIDEVSIQVFHETDVARAGHHPH